MKSRAYLAETEGFEPSTRGFPGELRGTNLLENQQVRSDSRPLIPRDSPQSVSNLCQLPPSLIRRENRERLSADEVRRWIAYDPNTGEFTWRERKSRAIPAGSPAGNWNNHGRRHIRISGIQFAASHIAFLIITGRWPEPLVDHADGDTTNNRWSNLREATYQANSYNRRQRKPRTLPQGVTFDPQTGRYRARIRANHKASSLGLFSSPDEASRAYQAAKQSRDHARGA